MLFRDRGDAGRALAERLRQDDAIVAGDDGIVLALPRGGVVVGYEVARALGLPLDVIVTRKIGAPGNPEYAIGAIAENGALALHDEEIAALGIPRSYLEAEIRQDDQEITRRLDLYRGGRGLPPLRNRTAIVVDDGVATGYTTAAAIQAARKEGPRRIVLAIPVGPLDTVRWLATMADEVVCLATPEPFFAVGRFYDHFDQIDDAEVRRLLDAARPKETEREAGAGGE